MHGANSSVEGDLCLVFEGNVIVRLFTEPFSVSSDGIIFLVDPYYWVCSNVPIMILTQFAT